MPNRSAEHSLTLTVDEAAACSVRDIVDSSRHRLIVPAGVEDQVPQR